MPPLAAGDLVAVHRGDELRDGRDEDGGRGDRARAPLLAHGIPAIAHPEVLYTPLRAIIGSNFLKLQPQIINSEGFCQDTALAQAQPSG